MENKDIICPMRSDSVRTCYCEKNNCAWWDDSHKSCCMTNISFYLSEISGDIAEVKKIL